MTDNPKSAPEFHPGTVIASDLYMGVITGAFWTSTWNYIIGENADTQTDDKLDGYRVGSKFIKRGDIKWVLREGKWQKV